MIVHLNGANRDIYIVVVHLSSGLDDEVKKKKTPTTPKQNKEHAVVRGITQICHCEGWNAAPSLNRTRFVLFVSRRIYTLWHHKDAFDTFLKHERHCNLHF